MKSNLGSISSSHSALLLPFRDVLHHRREVPNLSTSCQFKITNGLQTSYHPPHIRSLQTWNSSTKTSTSSTNLSTKDLLKPSSEKIAPTIFSHRATSNISQQIISNSAQKQQSQLSEHSHPQKHSSAQSYSSPLQLNLNGSIGSSLSKTTATVTTHRSEQQKQSQTNPASHRPHSKTARSQVNPTQKFYSYHSTSCSSGTSPTPSYSMQQNSPKPASVFSPISAVLQPDPLIETQYANHKFDSIKQSPQANQKSIPQISSANLLYRPQVNSAKSSIQQFHRRLTTECWSTNSDSAILPLSGLQKTMDDSKLITTITEDTHIHNHSPHIDSSHSFFHYNPHYNKSQPSPPMRSRQTSPKNLVVQKNQSLVSSMKSNISKSFKEEDVFEIQQDSNSNGNTCSNTHANCGHITQKLVQKSKPTISQVSQILKRSPPPPPPPQKQSSAVSYRADLIPLAKFDLTGMLSESQASVKRGLSEQSKALTRSALDDSPTIDQRKKRKNEHSRQNRAESAKADNKHDIIFEEMRNIQIKMKAKLTSFHISHQSWNAERQTFIEKITGLTSRVEKLEATKVAYESRYGPLPYDSSHSNSATLPY